MDHSLKLAMIPDSEYSDYRYNVIFNAYKWDPQVYDHNTVAKYVALIDQETAEQLEMWAEQLAEETILMEEATLENLSLAKELGLPKKIYKALKHISNYDRDKNVRLMRFDFHPTSTGWALSEVNSDVPGGLAEASVLPEIAGEYFSGYVPGKNVASILFEAFGAKTNKGGMIAFVHATSYSDDRQVMQFLSDYFSERGFNTIFAAPDHLRWVDKQAISILKGREGKVDGIIRFFPLEWFATLPQKSGWVGYFNSETPSCSHPIAMFTQSKRLPLIWDKLGVDIPTWKKLLPETRDPRSIKAKDDNWIYKPALGRVGEGISIKAALAQKELSKIEKAVRKQPRNWVAQQMFKSQPLITQDGESYHICVGVFTVDNKCAGFYGRISLYPRIDDKAKDIPILVLKKGEIDER